MKLYVVQVRSLEIELPNYKGQGPEGRDITDVYEILKYEKKNFEDGQFQFEEIENVEDTRFYLEINQNRHELVPPEPVAPAEIKEVTTLPAQPDATSSIPEDQAAISSPATGEVPTLDELLGRDKPEEEPKS